jgi:hypothetical protein
MTPQAWITSAKQTATELLKIWAAQLDRMRFELNRNLGASNVLLSEQRESLLSIFCDQLVIEQQKFLHQTEAAGFRPEVEVVRHDVKIENLIPAAELFLAVGTGAAAVSGALSWVVTWTTTTTGWWFWATSVTTPVTLVASISGKLGLPEAVIIGAIFLLATYLCFKAVRCLSCSLQRKLIRRRILKNYDRQIRCQLMDWARSVVNGNQV